MVRRDYCDDEILRELRRLYGRCPVHVSASELAERIGADGRSVGRRLARLGRAGAVEVRTPGGQKRYVPASAGPADVGAGRLAAT